MQWNMNQNITSRGPDSIVAITHALIPEIINHHSQNQNHNNSEGKASPETGEAA